MTVKKILVVGAGNMGAGIAQLCAQRGFEAVLTNITLELSTKGKSWIEKGMQKRVDQGKIAQAEKDSVLSRISIAGDLSPAKECDFVIESVVENMEIKRKVFAQLDNMAGPDVILATNTTSLPISGIAEATRHPERVVQMHFFNPPTIMKLVEIMPGKKTAPETLKAAEEMAKQLGPGPLFARPRPLPGL